ncbi:unnamed protein product [Tilletia controversa]|nr:unnamed protein product [Tilletia controversa]
MPEWVLSTDEEEARLAAKLHETEVKVGLQASRIKELEKESANADLEIAKLLKVRDRMEQENTNYAMSLAAKQQELSLLKRNSGRTSTANMTTAAMPLGMKTPRASDRHRDEQVDPPLTVRRRPPTAVLQSMILNTETPLPSSRIASRYKNGALHPESSGKESATETGMETEEEESESAALKPRLSSRASLGSVAGRASRVAVNDENVPPVSRASSSASIATATATGSSQINGVKRARSSLGAAALSSATAATRASVLGARPASRASLGGISNASSTAASRLERPRPSPPSRSVAPSPTPSMASVSSTKSFASSAASTSTRTGVLRSAATARKSGVEASRYAGGGGAAPTPTPASASGRTNGGNVLGRDRVASRPRESGAMGRTSSSSAAPTTASAARTTLKRSTPDEDLDAVVRGSDHYSASTSALPATSGSTTSLRSTIVAARHARPLGTSLSSISMGQSNRSMSTSAVQEGEMTVAEMKQEADTESPRRGRASAQAERRGVAGGHKADR